MVVDLVHASQWQRLLSSRAIQGELRPAGLPRDRRSQDYASPADFAPESHGKLRQVGREEYFWPVLVALCACRV
jgi:hypothetical protein